MGDGPGVSQVRLSCHTPCKRPQVITHFLRLQGHFFHFFLCGVCVGRGANSMEERMYLRTCECTTVYCLALIVNVGEVRISDLIIFKFISRFPFVYPWRLVGYSPWCTSIL